MKIASAGTPQDYVRQLRLRNPISSKSYRWILNGFQRFIAEQAEEKSISQATVRQWLNDRILVWPRHLVAGRARLVDRYLDWMVKQDALASNPFAELRREYGQRATKPIVQALLMTDFERALEALRPLPRFGSFLGQIMRDHLELMQAMGYRYRNQENRLLQLDRFLQRRADLSDQPLTVLIREWTSTGSTPQHVLDCHLAGRTMSTALFRIDPTVKTIPWDKRIDQQARQLYRRPYIFSDEEFLCLLEVALRFPCPRSPLRPQTLHMMLVLAYCAGLRLGEIVRLNVGDFDTLNGAIEIRLSKFFKSRRLPLSESVVAALQKYLDARKQAGAPTNPDSALFWHQQAAGRYSRVRTWSMLTAVLRRAELKPKPGRVGPRIHDLRHAFVVNRMLRWYREGINPQPHLPYLATYLGHRDINSTLVYLTITQELLQRASERFRTRGAQILRASSEGENA
ncbi:MAG: tyrosine-type recombinase/integrase [Silvibacterium sp.]